ncbi:MAG TPA: hypothetical protein VK066_20530 [Chloroflexota bacterium]|nr:hypothetical protein [Chloroflexota bacterium]
MKRIVVGILAASFAAVILPQAAAAQCEGGVTVGGFYARDGTYVPGHCEYTNPTTPGQLYPSGAEPLPTTNPAAGASRLPGQRDASGLLPVNSSDLGPAPSYVTTDPLQSGGVATAGPSVGPGTPVAPSVGPGTVLNSVGPVGPGLLPGQPTVGNPVAPVGLPGQFPQTGLPALNGNRALPSALTANGNAAVVPGPAAGTSATLPDSAATTGTTNLSLVNTAYGLSLGAAPARTDQPPAVGQPVDSVSVSYPNQ